MTYWEHMVSSGNRSLSLTFLSKFARVCTGVFRILLPKTSIKLFFFLNSTCQHGLDVLRELTRQRDAVSSSSTIFTVFEF